MCEPQIWREIKMADEEELYFANLDEFVNDEDKIVTYKWLSRTLSVPVNKAKQMLYAFVQKQKGMKSAPHLNITYVIGGRCSVEGDTVHRYVITHDKDLEETKKTFSPVTSLHIYSIQKCRLKDSNSLYTVDYEIQQQHNSEDNRWSHICCSSAKRLADDGVQRGTHKVANIDEKCSTTKMVNGDSESTHACKGLSTVGAEQKAKVSSSKTKKGQKSALEMFAAKPPTSKTEKNNNKKAEPAREEKEDKSKVAQAKSDNNKAGTMKSFFGQNTAVKKVTEKPAVTTGKGKEADSTKKNETIPEKQNQTVQSNREKKRELSSEDEEEPLPAKFSKAVKSDSKENKVAKGDKKKAQKQEKEKKIEPTKSNKAGKKKAVISEPDEEPEEKPKKRRKRMKELPKEDSSDDEKTVSNHAESVKKPSSDQGSSRSKSPLPQQQPPQTEKDTSRRRKRKRELKSKTFMNDEGYMVTEKVWESESTDASDDELQITHPPVNEKRPSPAKKAASKKTHTDMKNKTTKQASLTSFFKKS